MCISSVCSGGEEKPLCVLVFVSVFFLWGMKPIGVERGGQPEVVHAVLEIWGFFLWYMGNHSVHVSN